MMWYFDGWWKFSYCKVTHTTSIEMILMKVLCHPNKKKKHTHTLVWNQELKSVHGTHTQNQYLKILHLTLIMRMYTLWTSNIGVGFKLTTIAKLNPYNFCTILVIPNNEGGTTLNTIFNATSIELHNTIIAHCASQLY